MKKIFFLTIGLISALAINAANYQKNEATGMYDYTGPEVETFSVDFSTWAADSLVDEAVGKDYISGAPTLKFTERGNIGFQKFVIYPKRWMASGITLNAIFHNGKDNAGLEKATDAATVFLPTIKSGIKSLTLTGTYGGKSVQVLSYNSTTEAWDELGLLAINTFADYTLNINSADVKTLAFRTLKANGGAYLSITNISITPMEETPTPEPKSLYKKTASGIYEYQGEPVSAINVDFTSWATTDLPAKLSDTMPLAEVDSLGFMKWKIASRACGEKGTVNALFNNDNGDFPDGPKNNVTANRPRIYLPTTVRGVKTLSMFGGTNSAVSLYVYYKDEDHTSWTRFQIDGADATLNFPAKYGEASLEMNTKGQTTIYMELGYTSWPAFTNIDVELEEAPTSIQTAKVAAKVSKTIENGKLILIRDGIKFNAIGQVIY